MGPGRSWPRAARSAWQGEAVPAFDLNCDLGEGFGVWSLGDDAALLELVTSANVACGFHAGDPSIMRRVCARAASLGVAVGAQVGYRDLVGFGRRAIVMDPRALADEVLYQVAALDGIARSCGTRVSYVKPHGALYNVAAVDPEQAEAVVAGVAAFAPLPLLGLPGSVLLAAARRAGIPAVGEAFADRAYTREGRLVPRGLPGAVLADPDVVARRAVGMVVEGVVHADDGSPVRVEAESLCVHGDTPGAVAIARAVREALERAGVELRPFAPPAS